MAKHFPLTSAIWMEWLEDELKIGTTLEEKQEIVELFEQAIKDYLCKQKVKTNHSKLNFFFSG